MVERGLLTDPLYAPAKRAAIGRWFVAALAKITGPAACTACAGSEFAATCHRLRGVLKSQPMRRVFLGILLCTASIVVGPANVLAQDPNAQANAKQNEKSVSPEAIQGCYDLTLSPWFPEMRLGDDEELITPPPRVQLFAEKGTEGLESKGYLVRPAPGVKPSIHSSTYWLFKGPKSLEITFTDGFSGLVMSLKTADAETLHGRAITFWDFKRKKQIAEVMARRVPCARQ